jgi:poly(3-hydroxybutyrate) depolymerase
VILYTEYDTGHTWPGGAQYLPPDIIGKVSHNIDMPALLIQFFLGHRLPQVLPAPGFLKPANMPLIKNG